MGRGGCTIDPPGRYVRSTHRKVPPRIPTMRLHADREDDAAPGKRCPAARRKPLQQNMGLNETLGPTSDWPAHGAADEADAGLWGPDVADLADLAMSVRALAGRSPQLLRCEGGAPVTLRTPSFLGRSRLDHGMGLTQLVSRRAKLGPPGIRPQAEVIHRRGPWRIFEAVALSTLEWVEWL
jgi:hypothetical protein